MKTIKYFIIALAGGTLLSCSDLDLSPLDGASTEGWYQTREQFEMNLNTLLLHHFWPQEKNEFVEGSTVMCMEEPTDDWTNRSTVNAFLNGSLNGQNTSSVPAMYKWTSNGISRCNIILNELKGAKGLMSQDDIEFIEANARFYRACFYSRMIMLFGDAILWEEMPSIEESYNAVRTDRFEVLEHIYEQFDWAAERLPESYSGGEVKRATCGAAWAMKARVALHFASILNFDKNIGDPEKAMRHYGIARDAAENCIDLGVYTLHDDFGNLFLNSTKNSAEGIFTLPRSKQYSNGVRTQYMSGQTVTTRLPRLANSGIGSTATPSWDLLCSFLCSDGKPIDESSLYDPKEPFKNRDPRCTYTIVEFGTRHIGVDYNPHFDVKEVWSYREGKYVENSDTRSVQQYASYNGLVLKKGIDDDWLAPFEVEPDKLIMRYADVLLMYAEAKIELNDIDDSVFEAMNRVRARAYKASVDSDGYPRISETDQSKLRTILRTERRMEFAFEGLRIYDIYRWRIAGKVLNSSNYGLPLDENRQRSLIDDGMWFMGGVPPIDENGSADFSKMPNISYAQILSTRVFVEPKHYLWPLPTDEIVALKNVTQNDGY